MVAVSVFIKTFGHNRDSVREDAAGRYLSLKGLLATHFREAEFVPIRTPHELSHHTSPFRPAYALEIVRRVDRILLDEPLKHRPVGFGAVLGRGGGRGGTILHTYPWYGRKADEVDEEIEDRRTYWRRDE